MAVRMNGVRARRLTALAVAGGLVIAGAVGVTALTAGAAGPTNGSDVVWAQTQCFALVGGSGVAQDIDVSVQAVVPNNAALAETYDSTIPGGTANLPSSSGTFNIGSYSNIAQTYLFRSSAAGTNVTINSATPQGGASNNGNPVAYNASFTNVGTNAAIANEVYAQAGGGTISYSTSTPHGLSSGQVIDIVGASNTDYNQTAVAVNVGSATSFSINGNAHTITGLSWSAADGGTITYTTQIRHMMTVGQNVTVFGNTPAAWNETGPKRKVASVPAPNQFTITGTGTQPANPTVFGTVNTLGNPGAQSANVALRGSSNSLATVKLSTPSANPGELTTPDVAISMTAPNANSTITSYGAQIQTTANLLLVGPAPTTCKLPHYDPQTDGISATIVGTGGPTTSSYPSCRPPDVCASTTTTPTTAGPSTTTTTAAPTTTTTTTTTTVPPTTTTTEPTTTTTTTTIPPTTTTTTIPIPEPVVTDVNPSSGPATGGTEVTITGTGFTDATDVDFGATPAASFTVDNDTTITATAPAHAAGTVNVSVTTAGGTSANTANDDYTFVAAPTVTDVNPVSGPTAGGTPVTITGTGFTGATDVDFGATPAASFTVDNDTTITATSPAHAAGVVDISVTTVGGTSANTANDNFTFVPAPTITAVSPSEGPSSGGTSVTITGTNFTGVTDVDFGATPAASFTVDNDTTITATSPAHAAGTVGVSVTSTGGTSANTANDDFTFVAAPTVTAVAPATGPTAGGTSVTITGTGFTGATDVDFGATPAASFTVDNDTTITATSPAHAAGTVNVSVTTVGGTSANTANDDFTFEDAEVVCSTTCISIGDRTQLERDALTKTMTFPVTLSEPSTSQVTVNYTVTNGSATGGVSPTKNPGADFKTKTGTITFKVNLQGITPIAKTVAVPIWGDETVEGDETFTVTLSAPTGGPVLGKATGLGTIVNDDGITSDITVGVGDGTIVVQEAGKQSVKFPVTLSEASAANVTVTFNVTQGTATWSKRVQDGGDFGGVLTKTLTFLPNQTLKYIVLPVYPDLVAEPDAQLTVGLSGLTGTDVTLLRPNGTGTLLSRS